MVGRAAIAVVTVVLTTASTAEAATTTRVFGYTGGVQTLQLPEGVGTIDVAADGAAGGTGLGIGIGGPSGGLGGHAGARIDVPAGALLYVMVGGRGATSGTAPVAGGFNGGGTAFASGGSGGGASDVRLEWPGAPNSLDSRLVVAGGGGGAALLTIQAPPVPVGGAGGAGAAADLGGDGVGSAASGGHGGGRTAGGAAGTGVVLLPPTAGAFGLGGNGGAHGGGGGGGWYGGGGGSNENPTAGGGGAGSSFVTDFGRIGGATFGTAAVRDASVSITYDAPEASLSTSALAFAAQPAGTAGVAQHVTLSATGAVPLALRSVRAGADFLVSDDCPTLIAAGASCAIDVRFAPQAPGDSSATLSLDTGAGPLTVALSGAGTSAPAGAPGPAGPPGPPGPTVVATRKVALTTCVKSRCRTRSISGADKLAVAGTATLKRGRRVLARGHARDGLLRLSSAKTLAKGRYTLTVTGLDANGRPRTQRATVRIG
jgi:Glycine rich protein